MLALDLGIVFGFGSDLHVDTYSGSHFERRPVDGEGVEARLSILVDKAGPPHCYIANDDAGNPQVIVEIDSADSADIPRGLYWHQCRVTLSTGVDSVIESGGFAIAFTAMA